MSNTTFSASEVFEIAEQIERNGGKFYRQAAEQTDDPGAKALLMELARMEDGHESVFAHMAKKFGENPSEFEFDPDGLAGSYLKAWADVHVFNMKEESPLSGNETVPEILEMALGREHDAITFFTGVREAMNKEAEKDKITAIIREEMSHVTMLGTALNAIKSNK